MREISSPFGQLSPFGRTTRGLTVAQRALLALFPSLRLKTVRCELPAQPGWTAYAAGQFGGLLDCGHPLPGVDLASGPYHKLNCAEALP